MAYCFAPPILECLTPEQLWEWPQRLRNAEVALLLIYGGLHGIDPEVGRALEAYVNGQPLSPAIQARIWRLMKEVASEPTLATASV